MTLKRTDLAKSLGLKINQRMKQAGVPERFGTAAKLDKREQRKLDQERGLIPFAVKLDGELVNTLRTLATERQVDLNDLTAELLRQGLQAQDAV